MRVRITKSIRWRLQLWLAFLLVAVLGGFGFTVYELEQARLLDQVDDELSQRVTALSRILRNYMPRPGWPPPMENTAELQLPPEAASLFDETRTNGFYFVIWRPNGTVLKRSTNAPATVPPARRGDMLTHTRILDANHEVFHFGGRGECVLAGRSVMADLEAAHRFGWWLIALGSAVLALGLSGGWWVATRAIRPLTDISSAASRISAGNLSERITTAWPENEIGRLAEVLNSTFARLDSAFAQQKQFVADAAHELRTPLAVLISEAQTALARERRNAEYRETVAACLDTAQQMRRLVESLLELARLDAGQYGGKRTRFDLAENVRMSVERVRPLAAKKGIRIHCELAPAVLVGNPESFEQVVTNLIANAVHYNKPCGEIWVGVWAEGAAVVLRVADTGMGMAKEDLPHIFERFYRADKSRARSDGRSGLGLAISKAVVGAHGGRIEVESELGKGSTFTVRVPLS